MGRRRQAREYALKIMFQIDVGNVVPEEALTFFLQPMLPGKSWNTRKG